MSSVVQLKLPILLVSFKYITPTCELKIHFAASEVQRQCSKYVQKHTQQGPTAGEFSSLTRGGWLEYVDTLLYHFHDPPPRHPRVLSVFYISLLPTSLYPSLSDEHMDNNRQILPQATISTPPVIDKAGHCPPKADTITVDIATSCCRHRKCVFAY